MTLRPTALKLPSSTSSSIPRYVAVADRVRPATPPETPQLSSSPDSSISSPSPPFPSPSTSSSYNGMRPRSSLSMSICENVQVMVRMRPLSAEELQAGQETCWDVNPDIMSIQPKGNTSPEKVFHLDAIVDGESNSAVYDAGIGALVRSTMAGYNGTVFAYGQTASGKTYTMMGKVSQKLALQPNVTQTFRLGTPEQPGVIPRAINEVFTYIEEHAGEEFLLRVSYLEIYNEKIRDLLATSDDGRAPDIVEDKKRGVYVRNLNEIIVTTPDQVIETIKKGELSRHVSATDYNARSSRSHTLFQMTIESRRKHSYQGTVKISQLNLIDLAGSEKAASDADRRKEGACINKSLLTLGTVISQLSSPPNARGEKPFVPYRNSTLTRILQTSLSGNARILVICTINPTMKSKNESLNTLRFAQRAKLVKTTAKLTKVSEHSELQKCLEQIEELQNVMKEKTEQEEETCKRLSHLLGLILTSSKTHHADLDTIVDPLSASITSNGSASQGTVQEVIEQCEKGLTVHREEMVRLEQNLLAANQEITNLKLKLAAAEENDLALNQKCDSLEAAIRLSQEKERSYEEELQLAKSEINDLYDQLQCALDRHSTLEALLEDVSRERDEYVQHNREYKQQVEHLMSRMASLENELKEKIAAEENICTIKDTSTLTNAQPIPLDEDVTVVEQNSQDRGKVTQKHQCNSRMYGGLWMAVLAAAVYAAQLHF